jgi:UDP-N-acetylglucosamine--N-acetylmuramyl-(pentapeptide) pyrophosphoryl-undecaprenol N-acetylglucosamine transferase
VICRAGALTLSELTATGSPAILVPYPHATDDHQSKNAQALVDVEAALLVEDRALKQTDITGMIRELLDDEERLTRMSLAARSLGRTNAAEDIVQRIMEFMGWR